MIDATTAFLLGPVVFIPELLGLGENTDIGIFIASGLGTAMWATVVSVIGGFFRR